MCNLSLAVSKHREDGAQRGRLRRGAAIHQDRLAEGRRNRTAARQISVLLMQRCSIAAGYMRISGQCNNYRETNHITKTCQHEHAVSFFACGKKPGSRATWIRNMSDQQVPVVKQRTGWREEVDE